MAENHQTGEFGRSVERGWQMAIAFGQGAVTMQASRRALALAFTNYGRLAEDDEKWNARSVLILEFARAIGRTAAAHAARAGRCVIDYEDVEFALRAVRSSELEPLFGCPLTD